MRAIEQGTSLSAKVSEFLQDYVNEPQAGLVEQRAQATARLMAAMEAATPPSASASTAATATATAPRGRRRTLREELYACDFRARDRKAVKAATERKAGRGR